MFIVSINDKIVLQCDQYVANNIKKTISKLNEYDSDIIIKLQKSETQNYKQTVKDYIEALQIIEKEFIFA